MSTVQKVACSKVRFFVALKTPSCLIRAACDQSSMQLKQSRYDIVLCPLPIPLTRQAAQLGSTTVGIATRQGVVLAVEKRTQSSLLDSDSVEKIMEIDAHVGCAMSGLTADARTMVDHARVTAQNHAFTFNEPIKVESVTQSVGDLALRFGEGADEEEATMVRPVSLEGRT